MHLLSRYQKRPELLVDLQIVAKQLQKVAKASDAPAALSVKSDVRKVERQPNVEKKLGEQKVRLLIKQYQEGAEGKDLAVRFDISLNAVRRLLKKYGARRKDSL